MEMANGLKTRVKVFPWSFDAEGHPNKKIVMDPGRRVTAELPEGSYGVVRDYWQGAFIGVMHMKAGGLLAVVPSGSLINPKGLTCATFMLEPGDIGPIPSPTPDVPLPNDSPPVFVGIGWTSNENLLIRTQQYRRTADSLSLAPDEKRTISITALHGLQEESSDTETVASSIHTSASAGWGAISASVNTSLESSHTVSHAYTVTESTQRFDEVVYTNESDKVETFFSWQLFDVVTIYGFSSGKEGSYAHPIASLVSARPPALFMGPYGPANLLRADEVAPAPPAIEGQ